MTIDDGYASQKGTFSCSTIKKEAREKKARPKPHLLRDQTQYDEVG